MPQFDPSVYSSQIIWLAITFTVLYFLMARLALPRIAETLEERSEKIADDLDQAEVIRRDSEKMREDLEASLRDARAAAVKAVQNARDTAQKRVDARLAELEQNLKSKSEAAEARIAAEKNKAMEVLESVATEVCQDIVAKLIGERIAEDHIARAVTSQTAGKNS